MALGYYRQHQRFQPHDNRWEMLPTPDSVKRQDQVEVGMGLLSLSTPDVCGGDQEMADMQDEAATTPDTCGGDQEMADVPDDADTMPDTCESMLSNVTADVLDRSGSHKRKRSVCPGSERRRVINYSERQYYLNEEYYPTWRSYPLNKKRYTQLQKK